ncbi:MAG TPA: FtsH protease activity modulator HflK [Thermodesulfobacteriota bacterium]|nr:FtsH protease activity modulator HflK [Thermodesulfobacteriota bacterium]
MVDNSGRRRSDGENGETVWEELWEKWMRWRQGGGRRKTWPFLVVILIGIWLATGIYSVAPGEQGVVRQFGKEVALTGPGLRYRLPWPIETVNVVNMGVVRRVEFGFRTEPRQIVPEESLMLTGDENIVDAQAIVQYKVKEPSQYLFKVVDPDQTLRDSTEVALRSVIGNTTIDDAMTVGRVKVQEGAMTFLQQLLDTYETGLLVTEVKLQVVDPPGQVKDAFHEVVRAREDRERLINEARGYFEDIIPKARGEVEQMIRAAEAYRERRTIQAQGDAAKFLEVFKEYEKAKEVTGKRLYIETLERVLPQAEKIVIGTQSEGGLLQFLPLREAGKKGERPSSIKGGDEKSSEGENQPPSGRVPR